MNTDHIKDEAKRAAKVLKEGGVILYPTDTIWGLGCDATNPKAVETIYKIKQRVESKSLIILVNSIDMLSRYVAAIPEIAYDLIELSDKPLTIIYPNAIDLAPNALSSNGSVAIRLPNNAFCKEVIKQLGLPVISTSANISGEKPPVKFQSISTEIINLVNLVVDNRLEEGSTGKPSSIISLGLRGEVKVIRE